MINKGELSLLGISVSCEHPVCCLIISHYESQTLERKKIDEKYQKILGSTQSLSCYERRNFKNLLPQISAALIVASFYLVLGISLSYSAILIPHLEEDPSFRMTKEDASWVASISSLTTPIGTIAAGFLMDSYGRLNTIKMAALPGIAGWIIMALAKNIPIIILGRIISSLGIALGSSPSIVYVTEIARADMRGSLICLFPALTSAGMVVTFAKGWVLTWRQVAWFCTAYTLIPCLLTMLLPESPAWLVSKGRHQQARKSLDWLNRYQPQPEGKSETYAGLQLALLQKEHELRMVEARRRCGRGIGAWVKEFCKPTGYKPFLILTGLFFLQRFSGVYTFMFYSITFLREIGTTTVNPYLASMLIGITRLVISLLNTVTLSRTGRRPLLIVSCLLSAFFILMSAVSTTWIKQGSTTITWMPVVCLLMFIATSMIGLVPVPVSMMAEVFPLEIRGVAYSLVNTLAYFILFLALKMYPLFYETFNGIAGMQFFFGATALVTILYAYVFLPETYDKKLRDIERYFETNTTYIRCACTKQERVDAETGERHGSGQQNGDMLMEVL